MFHAPRLSSASQKKPANCQSANILILLHGTAAGLYRKYQGAAIIINTALLLHSTQKSPEG
jgi:hypothetical protein